MEDILTNWQEYLHQVVTCLQEKLQIQDVNHTPNTIVLYFKFGWCFEFETQKLISSWRLKIKPELIANELEQVICNMYLEDTIKK